MLSLRQTYRLLGIYSLITVMSGCSWTPQVETSIYDSRQVSVSLITVSEESFEADHPVTLQTNTIAHVLNGLRLRHNTRLLQKLFSSDNASQPVFTEEQAKILAPQLQKAFSQVTPEEHLAFQTQGNQSLNVRPIHGTMYVKSGDLYVSLTFTSPGAHAATKTAGRSVRPDQEGNGRPVVSFTPKEALRGEKNPHWLFGGEEKNHVVINVPQLALLHRQSSAPANQDKQEPAAIPQISDPKIEEEKTPRPTDTLPANLQPQAPTARQAPTNSETQMLLEEIRSLRKELADQKKSIELLKQE